MKNGYFYAEIWRSVYSLPQAGELSNKYLKENIAPHEYFVVAHTPGLLDHITCPIVFSLVVNNFGVKYVDTPNADHLTAALNHKCEVSEDWTGGV